MHSYSDSPDLSINPYQHKITHIYIKEKCLVSSPYLDSLVQYALRILSCTKGIAWSFWLFPFMPKRSWEKRNLFCLSQGSNTQPHNYQTNIQPFKQLMFHDISCTSRIILSRPIAKHIIKIIKQVNTYTNSIYRTWTQVLLTHLSILNHLR